MATRPSTSSASVTSMSAMRACACGDRTNAAASASRPRSSRNRPCPVTSRSSSRRGIGSPNIFVVIRNPPPQFARRRAAPCSWSLSIPRSLVSEQLRGTVDGLDDVLIAGAAAQVAGDAFEYVVLGRPGVVAQQGGDRTKEAGGTEPALQAVALLEGALHRRQRTVRPGEAFDGRDGVPGDAHRERQAGAHRLPIEEHRAASADAVLAPHMGPGEAEIMTEEVRKQPPRRNGRAAMHPVDG